MVIATLPPVMSSRFHRISSLGYLDAFRLNTGMVTALSPLEEIKALKEMLPTGKPVWIDLKCYQLRVTHWAVPTYGKIILNREIEHISLPAKVSFRGDDWTNITAVKGRQLFVDPPPRHAIGNGQAVNIIADELKIKGDFLLPRDEEYIKASQDLGFTSLFMLSYVQNENQVQSVKEKYPNCVWGLKIEDMAGLEYLTSMQRCLSSTTLVIARDDLFTNLKGVEKFSMIFDAVSQAISIDPGTIVASRLFTSLAHGGELSLGDLTDYRWLKDCGVVNFMLCDSLSDEVKSIIKATKILHGY